MRRAGRPLLLLVVLAALLSATAAAHASPRDVINDYAEGDQVINHPHTWADLDAAKAVYRVDHGDVETLAFAREVGRVIGLRYAGVEQPERTTWPTGSGRLPVWFGVLAAGAGLLIVTGIVAAVWRRRRPAPANEGQGPPRLR